jgi:hypothetical protein
MCSKKAQTIEETNVSLEKSVAVVGIGAMVAFAGFGVVSTSAATATANLG